MIFSKKYYNVKEIERGELINRYNNLKNDIPNKWRKRGFKMGSKIILGSNIDYNIMGIIKIISFNKINNYKGVCDVIWK